MDGLSPIKVMLNQEPKSNLDAVLFTTDSLRKIEQRLSKDKIREISDNLLNALQEMHKKIETSIAEQRAKHRDQRLKKKRLIVDNFVRDWVMVASIQGVFEDKLKAKWTGPFQIIDVLTPFTFKVQSIHEENPVVKTVHCQRMRFYAKDIEISEELLNFVSQEKEAYQVSHFKGLRSNGSSYDVHVHWLGFEDNEDSWEPVEKLYEDVPLLLHEFLKSHPDGSHIWEALQRG